MNIYFEQQSLNSWVIYRGLGGDRKVAGVISEAEHLGDFPFCVAMIDSNDESMTDMFRSLDDAQQFALDNG